MHLIDDVYLIFAGAGSVSCFVAQVADIVHTVVGSRIHLHHVQNAAVIDALADLTLAAGVSIDRMQAVDCLCKDLGAGGFAGAAHAGKQVGVAHTAGGDLIAQGRHNAALTHHIFKPLGSPLAVQGSIHEQHSPFRTKSAIKKDSA